VEMLKQVQHKKIATKSGIRAPKNAKKKNRK
jgi:hypothetical protein